MENNKLKHRKFSKPFIFDAAILVSKAYADLKPSSIKVLLELYRRITIRNDGDFKISNNGKIHLTYKSAKGLLKMSAGTYNSAIDDLCNHGFIGVAHAGSGCQGDKTLFYILTDWKLFGTKEFKTNSRKKAARTSKGKPMGSGNI